jgi:hypothetical protein
MPKSTKLKANVFETDFEGIEVTTKTKIINTNWMIDIEKLFEMARVKEIQQNPNIEAFYGLNNGDIVYMAYGKKSRGVRPIKKKNSASFLNNLTVIMWVRGDGIKDSKFVNTKISRSGKFQVTGCKHKNHAINVAKVIWKFLINISRSLDHNIMKLTKTSWEYPVAVIRTDLINMDFTVGYKIDRKKVNSYVKEYEPDFISILEISHGYTGVNIKIPAQEPEDRKYKTMEWKWSNMTKPEVSDGGIDEFYELMINKADVTKHKNKQRYITLLVFQSGSVIISGSFIEGVRYAYDWVKETFADNRFIEDVE